MAMYAYETETGLPVGKKYKKKYSLYNYEPILLKFAVNITTTHNK
jgi:hypothetical protein